MNGWWYGSDTTPVPKRMRCVRSAAAARNSSGEAMTSQPVEWCSPHQNSSNPRRVHVLDEFEVAAHLQERVLADRVVGGQEGTELDVAHRGLLVALFWGLQQFFGHEAQRVEVPTRRRSAW